MQVANVKSEPKERAIKALSVPFQGEMLHPCLGLMYWYRWGKYVFDIRVLRAFRKLPVTNFLDMKPLTQAWFCRKMGQVKAIVGENDFVKFYDTASAWYDQQERAMGEKNNRSDIYSDTLPF